jgi:apolipoprotein N-acyltransferase
MNALIPASVEMTTESKPKTHQPRIREQILWILASALAFHSSYLSSATAFFGIFYLFALVQLAQLGIPRAGFYSGLSVGLLIGIGRLDFFWRIFGAGAIALWMVYAFWIGLFVAIAGLAFRRLPEMLALCCVPFLWCGLEYFRGELYYLRFSWLTPGMAFGLNPGLVPISWLGVYGIGFLLTAIACIAVRVWRASRSSAVLLLGIGMAGLGAWGWMSQPRTESLLRSNLQIAGAQIEFPSEKEVLVWLNQVVRLHPKAQLLVLSEYTCPGPVPASIRKWCREHARYLVIGGKEPVSAAKFYNTAFVIGPSGEIVFQQAKSVPIQFFNDGLPAAEQSVWQSPWGKIGLCICYDLSYSRVTDRLIELGAQVLIVPTMDVADWGRRQHELHARVGPIRAAEYRVPIFRLASSGISQAIDCSGRIISSAGFPGEGTILAASLPLNQSGRRPLDRWLAPIATTATGMALAAQVASALIARFRKRATPC